MNVLIFGAGSIGNHLANASRSLGWNVTICDLDSAALERTKTQIYPQRYGAWDQSINLVHNDDRPTSNDIVIIGTPPKYHLPLANEVVSESPQAILIEKPVSGINLEGADELLSKAVDNNVSLFVGYDHALSESVTKASSLLLSEDGLGEIQTLDVEFREFWGGIFSAHPWLDGPSDTYLGFWQDGGGATGEHSHAINLWQHFARVTGQGRITEVSATVDYVKSDQLDYDQLSLMNFKTEHGLVGRCVQDVITSPVRKYGRVQGDKGYVEFMLSSTQDHLNHFVDGNDSSNFSFSKTRPDDFILELRHIHECLDKKNSSDSAIELRKGLDTMLVILAVHKSAETGKTAIIDYSKGYNANAVSTK